MTLEELHRRIAEIEKWRAIRWNDDDCYKKMPRFGEPNLVEPDIIDVFPHLIKPGMTVFDVGAQAGHVTYELSKQVGPRGLVVSFEASPRTARKFLTNTIDAGLRNVEIINKAVCKDSGDYVKIFQHESQLNDSIIFPKNNSSFSINRFDYVETISLDNYCKSFDIWPKFIKFDIEGAEYDALLGSQNLIDISRPIIILEKSDHDGRCFSLLSNFGYRCYDLIFLRGLSLEDYRSSSKYNFLFLPQENDIFSKNLDFERKSFEINFDITGNENIYISDVIPVRKSQRIVFKIDAINFLDLNNLNAIFGLIDSRNIIIKRYIGRLHSILESYSEIVFTPKFDDNLQTFIQFSEKASQYQERFTFSTIN